MSALSRLASIPPSLHFSQAFYCGGGSGHEYNRQSIVILLPTINCIHARLRRLATKFREKCGLSLIQGVFLDAV